MDAIEMRGETRMTIGKSCVAVIAAALAAFAAEPSHAVGVPTILWIGERILQEAGDQCTLRIPSTRSDGAAAPATARLDPQLCESLRKNPDAFLSGVLGPDV